MKKHMYYFLFFLLLKSVVLEGQILKTEDISKYLPKINDSFPTHGDTFSYEIYVGYRGNDLYPNRVVKVLGGNNITASSSVIGSGSDFRFKTNADGTVSSGAKEFKVSSWREAAADPDIRDDAPMDSKRYSCGFWWWESCDAYYTKLDDGQSIHTINLPLIKNYVNANKKLGNTFSTIWTEDNITGPVCYTQIKEKSRRAKTITQEEPKNQACTYYVEGEDPVFASKKDFEKITITYGFKINIPTPKFVSKSLLPEQSKVLYANSKPNVFYAQIPNIQMDMTGLRWEWSLYQGSKLVDKQVQQGGLAKNGRADLSSYTFSVSKLDLEGATQNIDAWLSVQITSADGASKTSAIVYNFTVCPPAPKILFYNEEDTIISLNNVCPACSISKDILLGRIILKNVFSYFDTIRYNLFEGIQDTKQDLKYLSVLKNCVIQNGSTNGSCPASKVIASGNYAFAGGNGVAHTLPSVELNYQNANGGSVKLSKGLYTLVLGNGGDKVGGTTRYYIRIPVFDKITVFRTDVLNPKCPPPASPNGAFKIWFKGGSTTPKKLVIKNIQTQKDTIVRDDLNKNKLLVNGLDTGVYRYQLQDTCNENNTQWDTFYIVSPNKRLPDADYSIDETLWCSHPAQSLLEVKSKDSIGISVYAYELYKKTGDNDSVLYQFYYNSSDEQWRVSIRDTGTYWVVMYNALLRSCGVDNIPKWRSKNFGVHVVQNPFAFSISDIDVSTPILCHGDRTAKFVVATKGYEGSVRYTLRRLGSNDTMVRVGNRATDKIEFDGLQAGDYLVLAEKIKDNLTGTCIDTLQKYFSITQPEALNIEIVSQTVDEKNKLGSISVTTRGGTLPYDTYLGGWYGFDEVSQTYVNFIGNNTSLDKQAFGKYMFKVKDKNACEKKIYLELK